MTKHIVILGGGFGGIYAMFSIRRHMRKTPYLLTLINDKEYFAFTPFLSEVVGKILPPRDASVALPDLVKKDNEAFVQATVQKIDLTNRQIYIEDDIDISYDYLVIALGATTNFLHVPGAMEHSYVLKSIYDATRLEERIDVLLAEAAQKEDPQERLRLLTFAIVGGGATSIEVAGNIEEHLEREIKQHYPSIQRQDTCVMLITGGNEIARDFEPELRKKAAELVEKENIDLRFNTKVTEVQEEMLHTAQGDIIHAHTIIWAAGVKANSLQVSPYSVVDHDSQKFVVDEFLRLPDFPNVFALGDIAMPKDPAKSMPMLAQAAVTEGGKIGANLDRTERGKPLLGYTYHSKGVLLTIGKGAGIATVFGIGISGALAWFLWKMIYLYKYIDNKKKPEILYYWLEELLH